MSWGAVKKPRIASVFRRSNRSQWRPEEHLNDALFGIVDGVSQSECNPSRPNISAALELSVDGFALTFRLYRSFQFSSKKSAFTIFPGQTVPGGVARSTTAQSGKTGICRALLRCVYSRNVKPLLSTT